MRAGSDVGVTQGHKHNSILVLVFHIATPPEIDMKAATPTVTLDADEISTDMAARLTVTLLGQMLYMKGQVPL